MKKIVILSFFVMAVAVMYLVHSANSGSSAVMTAQLLLDDVEALTSTDCINGGKGASSCSVSGGGTVAGFGGSAGCSVSCSAGYYACCNITCTCVKYS